MSTSGADGGEVKGTEVAFNPVDNANFTTTTTIQSQVEAKKVEISLIGDLAPQASRLMDLDDVAKALSSKGIDDELLELGKLGGAATKYIPWMRAPTCSPSTRRRCSACRPAPTPKSSRTTNCASGGKPVTGEALAAPHQSWTAAVALDWLIVPPAG